MISPRAYPKYIPACIYKNQCKASIMYQSNSLCFYIFLTGFYSEPFRHNLEDIWSGLMNSVFFKSCPFIFDCFFCSFLDYKLMFLECQHRINMVYHFLLRAIVNIRGSRGLSLGHNPDSGKPLCSCIQLIS